MCVGVGAFSTPTSTYTDDPRIATYQNILRATVRSSYRRGQWHFVLYSLRNSLRARASQQVPAKSSYSCMHVSISSATATATTAASHKRTTHVPSARPSSHTQILDRLGVRARACLLVLAAVDAAAAVALAAMGFVAALCWWMRCGGKRARPLRSCHVFGSVCVCGSFEAAGLAWNALAQASNTVNSVYIHTYVLYHTFMYIYSAREQRMQRKQRRQNHQSCTNKLQQQLVGPFGIYGE